MKIAEFEKVGIEEFTKAWTSLCSDGEDVAKEIYDQIILPKRKTCYSAGHDFHMPDGILITPGGQATIPTGIKCNMNHGYVMLVFPRSSLGIKKNMVIANTVPVVDADYYGNIDNDGHIFICIKNCGNDVLQLKRGDAFAQAVFVQYGVADNGDIAEERTGGIGSTGR